MTMFVSCISSLFAAVAVDSMTWDQFGPPCHTSKIHVASAAGTVFVVRGAHMAAVALGEKATRLRSVDEIIDAAPLILEQAHRVDRQRPRSGRYEGIGAEAFIVGPSPRLGGNLRAVYLRYNDEGLSPHIVPSGFFAVPWQRGAHARHDIVFKPDEIVDAARRQAAYVRGLYPEISVGGDLVLATVERKKITVETIARDI